MAVGDERQQGVAGEFSVGMRVLAVDDDHVCLKILEALLRHCKYHVTTAVDGETALRLLRAGKKQYDLVISDVYMPDMDGFRLLELIGLEMDIPVIMLSASEEKRYIVKGISSGACDYLVKPVKIKELKNIWQHVVRRRIPDLRMQPVEITKDEWVAAKSTEKTKCSKRRMSGEYNADENKRLSSKKKPKVTWTNELHGRFLHAVNQIGIDDAVPKKILEIMNVSYITRDTVASHLQKYRIYLKKVSGYTGRRSHTFVDSSERWNSCHNMQEYGSSLSSKNIFSGINTPYHFGDHGVQLPTQSFHPRNPQSFLGMRPIVPGDSMLKDVRKLPSFSLGTNSFANISDGIILDGHDDDEDGDDELTTCYPRSSYANILHNKLLEASKGIPSESFEDTTSNATISVSVNKLPMQSVAMSVPMNQFLVQSPQLGNHHLVQINCTLPVNNSHFQNIAGNCSKSLEPVVPVELLDLGHNGETFASLSAPQTNIHKINQLARLTASSGKIPVLRDQITPLISNPTPKVSLGEPMLPFDIEGSMDMLDENFVFGGSSSISSALPNLEIDNVLAPTSLFNGESTVGSQAPDGQLNYKNNFLQGTDESNMDNFGSMDMLDENFAVAGSSSISSALPNLEIDNVLALTPLLNGESTVGSQASDGQLNYKNNFLPGIDEPNKDNPGSMDMLDENFAVGGSSSISSALPNLEIDNVLAPTLLLNGENTIDSQAPDGQLNYKNNFLPRIDEPNMDNPGSMDMLDENFAVGGSSSISSALPNLEIDNVLAPTLLLNGESTIGSQTVDGQLNYNNNFLPGTDEPNTHAMCDEVLPNFQNQKFGQDDSFMDGDWI